jgi:tetratricopeptide (TPR) repeat protein
MMKACGWATWATATPIWGRRHAPSNSTSGHWPSSARSVTRGGEGHALGNLGICYADLGQKARAIELCKHALAIAREIGDRQGEGVHLTSLGNRCAELGQTARAIELYEQALEIAREMGDRRGEGNRLGNLGNCYANLGQTARATELYEHALAIAREIGDRLGEGSSLGNLGTCYARLGQTERALEFIKQTLAIRREIGDRRGEAIDLGNLVSVLVDQGDYAKVIQHARESVRIAKEIAKPASSQYSSLATAHLCVGDLPAARAAAETAWEYDELQNNHYALALLGLIALRQGDGDAAREAFAASVAQADALLAHTAQYFQALDSRGLALCGLALCEERNPVSGRNRVSQAVAAYRDARAVNHDAGIVASVLRLFDALAVADTEGRLAWARAAAAGEDAAGTT